MVDRISMRPDTRLVERIEWVPVHGATTRIDDDGSLVLRDGATLDWHLLRWSDPRLNGVRIKLTILAKPADSCDTNLYVHHWGPKDVCSIAKDGTVALNEGAEEIHVERRSDGIIAATIIFQNHHPTLSVDTGKPRTLSRHGIGSVRLQEHPRASFPP